MLDKALPTLEKLDGAFKNKNNKDFVVIFEPPSIHPRIINQHGVLSVANGVEKCQDDIFSKLKNPKRSVKKIIIKAKAKALIRDMLDQNNISERMLYPGLPGLCQWLKRYYSPGQPRQNKEEGDDGPAGGIKPPLAEPPMSEEDDAVFRATT
jgi:hypothetical protein